MSSTKHTPGPWEAHKRPQGSSVRDASGRPVAWCSTASVASSGGVFGIDAAMAQANARLIAAAPEMLEALRDCLGSLELYRHWLHRQGDHAGAISVRDKRDRVVAAIAKATDEGGGT